MRIGEFLLESIPYITWGYFGFLAASALNNTMDPIQIFVLIIISIFLIAPIIITYRNS